MIDLANRLTQETRIGPSSTTIVTTATYDGADNLGEALCGRFETRKPQ